MCIALTTAPSSPPINLNVRQVTSTSFMLSWSAPPLQEQNGLIRHYSVRCTHQEGDFEILTDSLTARLITNLRPFYNYTCSVAAVTIAPGSYSSTVLVTTLEDGNLRYFCSGIVPYYYCSSECFIAPTAPPLSLTVNSESSTSLSLQWLPPPEDGRNGIIIAYSVNITRISNGDSIEFTDIQDLYLIVESLRPYTQYSCSVAAHTVIGMGPYSIPLLALTNEDGMSY